MRLVRASPSAHHHRWMNMISSEPGPGKPPRGAVLCEPPPALFLSACAIPLCREGMPIPSRHALVPALCAAHVRKRQRQPFFARQNPGPSACFLPNLAPRSTLSDATGLRHSKLLSVAALGGPAELQSPATISCKPGLRFSSHTHRWHVLSTAAASPRAQQAGVQEQEQRRQIQAEEVSSPQHSAGAVPVVITLDLETTGFSPKHCRIVEVAARDMWGGDYSALSTLVNPEIKIPPEATSVHGIANLEVQKPTVPTFPVVASALLQFVDFRQRTGHAAATQQHMHSRQSTSDNAEGPGLHSMGTSNSFLQLPPVIIVAYNGFSYDFKVLHEEFNRAGFSLPEHWHLLDPYQMAKRAFKEKHGIRAGKGVLTLGGLFNRYNTEQRELVAKLSSGAHMKAHRAMGDVDKLSIVLHCFMLEQDLSLCGLLKHSQSASDYVQEYLYGPKAKKRGTGSR